MQKTTERKTLTGLVVSNKMDKTVVVKVERKFIHPKFKKVVKSTRKYSAHDEKNECCPGDFISIRETRPLSKTKRWRLIEIIKKGEEADKAS
ncbi:MAG: 30S ribosomal protein S17 [Nitrospina sp.]|nr:30S ribosomal protein S17 [Nitrospina sp.]